MGVAEVGIEPVGTCSASIGDLITACVGVLEKQADVKWDVTAMGTILDGDWGMILALVGQMDDACFKAGAARVTTNLRSTSPPTRFSIWMKWSARSSPDSEEPRGNPDLRGREKRVL